MSVAAPAQKALEALEDATSTTNNDATITALRALSRRRRSHFKPVRPLQMAASARLHITKNMFSPGQRQGRSPGVPLWFADAVVGAPIGSYNYRSFTPSAKQTGDKQAPNLLNETQDVTCGTVNPSDVSNKENLKLTNRRRFSMYKPIHPSVMQNASLVNYTAEKSLSKASNGKVLQPAITLGDSSTLGRILFGPDGFYQPKRKSDLLSKPKPHNAEESILEPIRTAVNSNPRKLRFDDEPRQRDPAQTSASTSTTNGVRSKIPNVGASKSVMIPKIVVSKIPVRLPTKPTATQLPVNSKLQRMRDYANKQKPSSKPNVRETPETAAPIQRKPNHSTTERQPILQRNVLAGLVKEDEKEAGSSQSSTQTSPIAFPTLTNARPFRGVDFGTQTTPSLGVIVSAVPSSVSDETNPTNDVQHPPKKGLFTEQQETLTSEWNSQLPEVALTPRIESTYQMCRAMEKLSCTPESPGLLHAGEGTLSEDSTMPLSPTLEDTLTLLPVEPSLDERFNRAQALVTPSHRMTANQKRNDCLESNAARAVYMSYKESSSYLRTPQHNCTLAVTTPTAGNINSKRLLEQISLLFNEGGQ